VTRYAESEVSIERKPSQESTSGWVKLAVLTAASAVAGGLATAWFYRKTLARLRETGENSQNPHFGISGGEKTEDPSDEF
jgi:flagellar basal body-associated protein FliL